nr:DUF123 domain-containing protein [Archaeoglobus neptunius]
MGRVTFRAGYYYYVGSANNGVHRIRRHFAEKKATRWHIDYISSIMCAIGAVILKESECNVALKLGEVLEGIRNFGCSDCRCWSHLFYSPNLTLEFLST